MFREPDHYFSYFSWTKLIVGRGYKEFYHLLHPFGKRLQHILFLLNI